MREQFHQQMARLHGELTRMGGACQEAIAAAAETLGGGGGAEAAREAERELDRLERNVERLCLKLLLRQQPVAGDLRRILAALKLISDLERIGDQAAEIAELRIPRCVPGVEEMARAAADMVRGSVDAFVREDLDLARSVQAAEGRMEERFGRVREELSGQIAAPRGGEMLDLLLAAKDLERIGGHAANVAEWVEYALTGTHPPDGGAREA